MYAVIPHCNIKMSFLKCLCLVLLAVAFSEAIPLKEDFELLEITPTIDINRYIPKEQLKRFVDVLKRSADAKQIINDEADEFLTKLNSNTIAEGGDPTLLEDQGFEFKFKWLLVTYTGKMKLERGWLQGLATLERVGDCTIESDGVKMTLVLPLSFTDLLFNYEYTAKLMGIGPKGGLDGSIRDTKFTVTVEVDVETLEATLESFRLNRQGKMSVKFTGNPLGDLIANILSGAVTTFLFPIMRIFISGWVYDSIVAVIALYNESICAEVGTCFLY